MLKWFRALDQILRGEITDPDSMETGTIDVPARGLSFVIILLAMIYGICMGSFSIFREIDSTVADSSDRYLQLFASSVKVPSLFLLTLLVTFPSLYVFNALVGSKLHLTAMLRLLIASLAVNVAVLSSLGPITAFFSVSTTSYRFMQLFNVLIFAIAGGMGLAFLHQTLNRMSQPKTSTDGSSDDDEQADTDLTGSKSEENVSDDHGAENRPDDELGEVFPKPKAVGALDQVDGQILSRHGQTVFRIWIVAFCLVGAQMGWVLRPFIGNPGQAFTWFRARDSNFFEAILMILSELLTW